MKPRTRPTATISDLVSDFIARTNSRNIPLAARDAAKLHLLDGLATMLGGAAEESSRILRRRFRLHKTAGQATAIGSHSKFSIEHAALINGVQGHVLDYDDAQLVTLASRPMGQQTHPTTPVLAAALALAESRKISGAALLASYMAGVEVACRLGDAVDPGHYLNGFHPTGTLGAFGAAAACAHMLQLKPKTIRHALGIAGTLASGLRANRGTMAKGLNAGRAAQNGIIAATLADDGFTASENIFDAPMGFLSAACRQRVDPELLKFGQPFFFLRPGISIKLYPCAGVLHPALDLALDLRARETIKPEHIERIRVSLDTNATGPLVYKSPKDSLQAKFSVNFAVAVALVDGYAGMKQFTAARLHDRKVKHLMKRIELLPRPTRETKPAVGIDTEIKITLRDGAVHRGRIGIARGHPTSPPSRAEIEDKLRQCADGILPPRQIETFLKGFWTLEQIPSISAWIRPLRTRR